MSFVIYLDHNATTPILPEVLDAMMPYVTADWGNPSSAYKFGAKLKSVMQTAREQVAELIGAHSMDVIFTSCATENNNAAIAAALRANPATRHIETSQVEHSSVLNYCMALEKQSQDSPQSTQRSQGTAPQSASAFSVPSVVDGFSDARLRETVLQGCWMDGLDSLIASKVLRVKGEDPTDVIEGHRCHQPRVMNLCSGHRVVFHCRPRDLGHVCRAKQRAAWAERCSALRQSRPRSTTVQVQQPKRLLPQLGVLVSIWMGHSPLEALA